jgi:sarcosine oxidase subunit beta
MTIGGVDGNGLRGRQTLRGNLADGACRMNGSIPIRPGPAGRPATALTRNLVRRVAELLPKAAYLNVIRSWARIVENTPDGPRSSTR